MKQFRDEMTSEGRGSLEFRVLLLLHLVRFGEGRSNFQFLRDFKGFREDYSVKVITFDRSLSRGVCLILPIFFFLSKLILKERKKLFEFIFEKVFNYSSIQVFKVIQFG